jgi:hypothetical protein
MKTPEQIEVLVKSAFAEAPGQFRPGAFFDDRLDCIRVITKDCSVLETRINTSLTVLEDNYADGSGASPYVGFTIKGARHFCHENGISLDAPIQMSALLDAILKAFPGPMVEMFVNAIARPLVRSKKIEQVETGGIPGQILQPAWALPRKAEGRLPAALARAASKLDGGLNGTRTRNRGIRNLAPLYLIPPLYQLSYQPTKIRCP